MKRIEKVIEAIERKKPVTTYDMMWNLFDDSLDELKKLDGESFIRSAAELVKMLSFTGDLSYRMNPSQK